ncbi:hypothetical protein QN277_026451 [Acacia crassicarpa]|uniref:C2H2-type domain-containing protein n=1 Tax=Acacia crassicarpa TaxID=499986 RepID=A0AAE1J7N3_9FABA|nr:hypothetical protein QN277_026451 [Acacia crassicarpa]
MEFNFLGEDVKAPPFQLPLPIPSLFSGPTLLPQGGFPVVPYTGEIMNPNGGAGEDTLRKMERERIRLEIISSEITRKLMLEREMALRRSLGGRYLLDEQVAAGLSLNHRPNLTLPPYDNPNAKPDLPKTNKNRLIMLKKPDPDTYREKRKAVTHDADDGGDGTEHAPVVVKKKPKNGWSCALCFVTVTSERALYEHFQGKKHKARDSAKKKMQIGMSTSACPSPPSATSKNTELSLKQSLKPTETVVVVQAQHEVTKVDTDQTVVVGKDVEEVKAEDGEIVEKVQITEDSGKKSGTETEQQQVGTIPNGAVNKKGFKFWCEDCNVGSSSLTVMDHHKRGKKHTNRVKRLHQNNDAEGKPSPAE